jgi:predicted transcriptional regulator
MSQLTIQIPDPVFHCLQERAKKLGKTPEVVAAECIAQSVGPAADDPLLKLAGAIKSGVPDAAERHDYYIGQALAEELRGDAHE